MINVEFHYMMKNSFPNTKKNKNIVYNLKMKIKNHSSKKIEQRQNTKKSP
jgi:hypothetical protein